MSTGTVSNPWGALQPSTLWGRYNNLRFMIQQMLAKVQTATLVKVVACSNSGGVSPVGTVDAQILVNQINSTGNSTPHVTMYGLPYLRIQGGSNAVILDPVAGDIGIAVFASRDISNVVSTKAQANPGSYRMHDFSDGMYLGGLLNGTPTQYLQFSGSGINIVSPAISANNGGTTLPLMSKNFLDYWNTDIFPFLKSLGYSGASAPTDSVTSILEAE